MSLSTSFALSGAVNDAMMDETVRFTAKMMMDNHREMPEDDFHEFLFQYSANLVAVTTSLVTRVFMTEDEISKMMDESIDLIQMTKEAEQE